MAEWVALPADKCQGKRLFDLVALTDATTGQPKVAPVAGLLEYMLAMAQGNAQSVPKGGEPAYRDTYSALVLTGAGLRQKKRTGRNKLSQILRRGKSACARRIGTPARDRFRSCRGS